MDNFEEKIKPFLQPLITRIEALEAENKQLREMITTHSKNAEKYHPKPHETHIKNNHHPKTTTQPNQKDKQTSTKPQTATSSGLKKTDVKGVNSHTLLKPPTTQKIDIKTDKPKSSQKQIKDKEIGVKPTPSPKVDKTKKDDKKSDKKQEKKDQHLDVDADKKPITISEKQLAPPKSKQKAQSKNIEKSKQTKNTDPKKEVHVTSVHAVKQTKKEGKQTKKQRKSSGHQHLKDKQKAKHQQVSQKPTKPSQQASPPNTPVDLSSVSKSPNKQNNEKPDIQHSPNQKVQTKEEHEEVIKPS